MILILQMTCHLVKSGNILVEESDQLFNYYLVNRFNHAKLQTAVSDIAREILDEEFIDILFGQAE